MGVEFGKGGCEKRDGRGVDIGEKNLLKFIEGGVLNGEPRAFANFKYAL